MGDQFKYINNLNRPNLVDNTLLQKINDIYQSKPITVQNQIPNYVQRAGSAIYSLMLDNLFISILIISTILTISALGCQEHIYNKNESQSLTLTRLFSPPNCKENIHYTKMFGCGTFYVIFILLCIFLNYHKKSQI